MYFICNKNDLIKGVNIVSKAVSTKTTMPILECILLEANDQKVTLIGNDMDMGIQTTMDAIIKEEGIIAVNAKIFSEIIRKLPDDDIHFETDDANTITIRCAKSKFSIPGQNGEEFPALPQVESDNSFVISQGTFKDMIRQTIFSIAAEDSGRPILTGELIDVREGYLHLVAVDGFRISMRRTPINSPIDFKVTVPGKALNEIHKILESEEDALMTVMFTGKYIMFKMNDAIVVTRLLEGDFLQYQRNLNMECSTKVRINKKELLDSIDRAALISKESKNSPVRLEIQNQNLIITSNTEKGSAYEEVALSLEGDGLTIAFNPRYYLEALRSIDDDEIEILFASSLTPCIIKNTETEDYKYFILPIRLHS